VVASYAAELRRLYSEDRLARYYRSDGDDLSMIVTYLWNIELCEALYPSLCALELTLRNSIDHVLSTHYRRPNWYDLPNVLQRDEIRARDQTKSKIDSTRKPVIPGRVVAGLNFGFWTAILSSLYGNSPKGPQLWTSPVSPLLAQAFPGAPATHQQFRGKLHLRFDELRRFRNRVFHYEAVFDDSLLLQRHARIIECIGWISPSIQTTTLGLDRFIQVHDSGQRRIRRKLKQMGIQ